MIGILFIFIFITAIIFIKGLYEKYGYIIIANILFLGIYSAFSSWWEPDYREFWIDTMFAFWLLTFFVFNFIIDKLKVLRPIPSILLNIFIFFLALLLFYFNFTGFIYPNSGKEFKTFDIMEKEKNTKKIEIRNQYPDLFRQNNNLIQ